MEYFRLSQDRRYIHRIPHIQNFNKIGMRKDFTVREHRKINSVNTVIASSPEPLDYIDVLDTQVFLVGKEIKKVFLLYDPSMVFKMFCLVNQAVSNGAAGEYYAPIFREADCVSPKSRFNRDKSHFEKLALFRRKIAHFPIFRVANINTEVVIVRLDVAESLLRRKLRGMKFERIEVDEDE